MNGLKEENWTAIRDENGRPKEGTSKRRDKSMLVKNVGDQESGPKWTILTCEVDGRAKVDDLSKNGLS